jgi:hypothetical protein
MPLRKRIGCRATEKFRVESIDAAPASDWLVMCFYRSKSAIQLARAEQTKISELGRRLRVQVLPSAASARLRPMESKVAKEAERALIEATQRLSPEERLNAFLAHCRLVMELHEAGQKAQGRSTQLPP